MNKQPHRVSNPYVADDRNVEIAVACGVREARRFYARRGKLWQDPICYEEAVVMAILRGRERYDSEMLVNGQRVRFFTYAHSLAMGAILEQEREFMRRPHDEQFSLTPRRGVGPESIEQERAAAEEARAEGDVLLVQILGAAADSLDERQYHVIELRYVQDIPRTDVAKILGTTPYLVRKIEIEALEILQCKLVEFDPAF